MLCADGEAEVFGRVREALFEVDGAFLRVVQFVGCGGAGGGGLVGVEGVRGVDCCKGFFEGRGHRERDFKVVAKVFWVGRRLF